MRNRPWLLVAVIGGIITVTTVLLWPPSEPVYQGKPLTHWLQAYKYKFPVPKIAVRPAGNAASAGEDAPTRDEAESAIRAIGTNALPTLLRMMEHRDNPLEDRLLALARKIPLVRIEQFSPLDPNYEAVQAFKVLGTNAAPAVPQLIEIYNRESNRETKDWVLPTLAEIGPPAKPAVPILLRAISGTNMWQRENAARALGEIHTDAAEVVPPLISCLGDPDPRLRLAAVMALRNFGKDARSAAPALLELIRDPNRSAGPYYPWKLPPGVTVKTPTIAEMATNALWEIDADAAAKAGMTCPW